IVSSKYLFDVGDGSCWKCTFSFSATSSKAEDGPVGGLRDGAADPHSTSAGINHRQFPIRASPGACAMQFPSASCLALSARGFAFFIVRLEFFELLHEPNRTRHVSTATRH